MEAAPLQTKQNAPTPHIGFRDERYTAVYLGVSVETLRSWRQQKRGPLFRKIGRCVRYSIADLNSFVDQLPVGGGQAA